MNRAQLVAELAEKAGLDRESAKSVVDTMIDTIISKLASGEHVNLAGFGCFSLRERKERLGRNPKTGEAVQVEASRGIAFRAYKPLRASVSHTEQAVRKEKVAA